MYVCVPHARSAHGSQKKASIRFLELELETVVSSMCRESNLGLLEAYPVLATTELFLGERVLLARFK